MPKLKPLDLKSAERRGFLGGEVWVAFEKAAFTDGVGCPEAAFAGYEDVMRWRREKFPRARLEHEQDGEYVWSTRTEVVRIMRLPLIRYSGSIPKEVLAPTVTSGKSNSSPAKSVRTPKGGRSCDACEFQEGRHYCLLHTRQMRDMDTKTCGDWTLRASAPPRETESKGPSS